MRPCGACGALVPYSPCRCGPSNKPARFDVPELLTRKASPMNLSQVSTRELLEALKRRGSAHRGTDGDHLEADADHLLKCLGDEVLNYPFGAEAHR